MSRNKRRGVIYNRYRPKSQGLIAQLPSIIQAKVVDSCIHDRWQLQGKTARMTRPNQAKRAYQMHREYIHIFISLIFLEDLFCTKIYIYLRKLFCLPYKLLCRTFWYLPIQ